MYYLSTVLVLALVNFANLPVSAKWGNSNNNNDGGKPKECADGHCHKKCYPTPHAMEGPFYVPAQPVRSDVREDRQGVPLQLELTVKDYNSECKPVVDADVHVWQPDALGVYSAYLGYYPLGKPGSKEITGAHAEPSDNSTFLRGIQKTDENGKVTFMTVYPGWYLHRALHIHFKVFVNKEDVYTGEVYFPEDVTDQVAKVKPYVDSKEERAANEEDWLFVRLDGFRSIATLTGDVDKGFVASLDIIID